MDAANRGREVRNEEHCEKKSDNEMRTDRQREIARYTVWRANECRRVSVLTVGEKLRCERDSFLLSRASQLRSREARHAEQKTYRLSIFEDDCLSSLEVEDLVEERRILHFAVRGAWEEVGILHRNRCLRSSTSRLDSWEA
jgi:hypothetical protein